MRRRRREQTILFPWERRGRLARLPWLRSRALLSALGMVLLLLLLGARAQNRAGVRATRARMLVLREALDAYRADHDGSCPPALAVLREEGYLHLPPVDGWGRPLQLTCPGRRHPDSYDLVSFGPSGDLTGLDRIE